MPGRQLVGMHQGAPPALEANVANALGIARSCNMGDI